MNLKPNKYSDEQMKQAFDLVKDKEHWKNPIKVTLPFTTSEETLDIIFEAVVYYTGSMAEIYKVKKGYRVEAIGYFMAVGA